MATSQSATCCSYWQAQGQGSTAVSVYFGLCVLYALYCFIAQIHRIPCTLLDNVLLAGQ